MAASLLAACNVFDPVLSDASDVDALLEDARAARANGNYGKAISLLEQALLIEHSHPVVRFELGSTLLKRDKLGLITLEKVTAHLLGARNSDAGTAARGDGGTVCTFTDATTLEPFDPRDVDDFEELTDARPSLVWVLELLNDPSSPEETPAMPPELTGLDICQVLGPDGLDYDRQVVLDALMDQFEDEEQVTGALVTNAVALTLTSYVNLFEQPDLAVDWFIVDGEDIGACVAESQYDLFVDRAQVEVGRAGQALISLDLLLHHTGNSQFEAIVDDAVEFYHVLDTDEVNPCSTAA